MGLRNSRNISWSRNSGRVNDFVQIQFVVKVEEADKDKGVEEGSEEGKSERNEDSFWYKKFKCFCV